MDAGVPPNRVSPAEAGAAGFSGVGYWLDVANSESSGQFVLGEPQNSRNKRSRARLRTVAELYPEVADPTLDDDDGPSCSAIESLTRQEPFVNGVLAQHALALLARLFRYVLSFNYVLSLP